MIYLSQSWLLFHGDNYDHGVVEYDDIYVALITPLLSYVEQNNVLPMAKRLAKTILVETFTGKDA